MLWGLPKARTCVNLLKIEIFYYKSGLRFAQSQKVSEKFFYSNSYTGNFQTRYLWNPRSDQTEILIMRSFRKNNFNGAIRYVGTVFLEFQNYLSTSETQTHVSKAMHAFLRSLTIYIVCFAKVPLKFMPKVVCPHPIPAPKSVAAVESYHNFTRGLTTK